MPRSKSLFWAWHDFIFKQQEQTTIELIWLAPPFTVNIQQYNCENSYEQCDYRAAVFVAALLFGVHKEREIW